MAKTTENWLTLIKSGASVAVNASSKTTDNLMLLAQTAAQTGVQLTVLNADAKTTDNLLQVVKAGRGHVTLWDSILGK